MASTTAARQRETKRGRTLRMAAGSGKGNGKENGTEKEGTLQQAERAV